uniref:Cytosol aminopeptidase n=1 Tax=Laticauda laticaudata TaxID=8630 RepID=A0A8C5S2J1_LATLA
MPHQQSGSPHAGKGLILGAFASDCDDEPSQLSDAGEAFDKQVNGKLKELLAISGPPLKKGKTRIFHGLHQAFPNVVVVGLGKKAMGINIDENWNEDKENIRAAVAAGCRQLQDLELICVEVDPCGDAQAAAEGAALSIFEYGELKQKKKPNLEIQLHGSDGIDAWQKGIHYAEGQNLARYLMESPANYITPTKFATIIEDKLKSFSSNTTVHKRDKSWIQEQGMGSFWSVAKGSDEPPVFLEVHYQGSSNPKEAPLVFVGKGITFDSGGISIKPSANMDAMRADMGGAATIFSAIVAAAELKLPINLIGLAPLCENLPSGRANKPGDVVRAMNGKTIQIDNTDAEGRLVLADALHYAHHFNPRAILDAATLTGSPFLFNILCWFFLFAPDFVILKFTFQIFSHCSRSIVCPMFLPHTIIVPFTISSALSNSNKCLYNFGNNFSSGPIKILSSFS